MEPLTAFEVWLAENPLGWRVQLDMLTKLGITHTLDSLLTDNEVVPMVSFSSTEKTPLAMYLNGRHFEVKNWTELVKATLVENKDVTSTIISEESRASGDSGPVTTREGFFDTQQDS